MCLDLAWQARPKSGGDFASELAARIGAAVPKPPPQPVDNEEEGGGEAWREEEEAKSSSEFFCVVFHCSTPKTRTLLMLAGLHLVFPYSAKL